MAIQTILYPSSVFINVSTGCCEQVYVCLTVEAAARTVDGSPLQIVTVTEGRYLGKGGQPRLVSFENPRCEDLYQYTIEYDDAIMQQGELLTCEDICEIFPYPCTVSSILNNIQTLPDWVVDSVNVVANINPATDTYDVTIPVIDRVNAVGVGVIQLDFSVLYDDTATNIDAFASTAPGGHTVTRAALLGGTTERIQIISQDANNLIAAGIDNGAFLDLTTIGSDSLGAYGTPAGGYRHTALDSTVQDIQILSQDASNLAEAGIDNGIFLTPSSDANNDISIAAGDSRVFSCAYPNDTVGQANSAAAVTAIDAAASYTIYTSPVLTFDNTGNACRAQDVLVTGDNTLQATLLDTGSWSVVVEESVDGGAFAPTGSAIWGPFAPVGIILTFPLIIPLFTTYTVPAGGTLTLQRRIIVTTTIPSPVGSQITAYALGMRAVLVGV